MSVMPRASAKDLDYLAARVHGRRSRLVEGERLEQLCHLASVSELSRELPLAGEFKTAEEFQRQLVQGLISEMCSFLKHLEGPAAGFLNWMLVRFQVEEIKVLLRHLFHAAPAEIPEPLLVSLPPGLALDRSRLGTVHSLREFAEALRRGVPRDSLREALAVYGEQARPFFFEGALDRGYLQELLDRAEQLAGEDREHIRPLALQEADTFHLMLVVRGRFHYGQAAETLLPLRVHHRDMSGERFNAMLAAPDIRALASLAPGRAIDVLPPERDANGRPLMLTVTTLETLARRRLLRLSNRAFRCGHLSLGAVVGYLGIRRAEVANLISVSEGIATGTLPERLSARLLRQSDWESAYV